MQKSFKNKLTMGHYGECYHEDDIIKEAKHANDVYHEFMQKTNNINTEDKEFLLFVLKHKEEFKSFMNLIQTINIK